MCFTPSGEITLHGLLDREQTSTYHVTTRVSDGLFKSDGLVRVHVEDVNDNAPTFTFSRKVIRISESEPAFTSVLEGIKAADKDEHRNAEIVYKLMGHAVIDKF